MDTSPATSSVPGSSCGSGDVAYPAGVDDGVIASCVTSLPTDDRAALIDEHILDRPGPIGDLDDLSGTWDAMPSDEPDWRLASTVFDGAVTAGGMHGQLRRRLHLRMHRHRDLLDLGQASAAQRRTCHEGAPGVMTVNDGRKVTPWRRVGSRVIRGEFSAGGDNAGAAARRTTVHQGDDENRNRSGESVRSLLVAAYHWFVHRRRVATRPWPSVVCCPCGSPGSRRTARLSRHDCVAFRPAVPSASGSYPSDLANRQSPWHGQRPTLNRCRYRLVARIESDFIAGQVPIQVPKPGGTPGLNTTRKMGQRTSSPVGALR
jgi:hypothetical protein